MNDIATSKTGLRKAERGEMQCSRTDNKSVVQHREKSEAYSHDSDSSVIGYRDDGQIFRGSQKTFEETAKAFRDYVCSKKFYFAFSDPKDLSPRSIGGCVEELLRDPSLTKGNLGYLRSICKGSERNTVFQSLYVNHAIDNEYRFEMAKRERERVRIGDLPPLPPTRTSLECGTFGAKASRNDKAGTTECHTSKQHRRSAVAYAASASGVSADTGDDRGTYILLIYSYFLDFHITAIINTLFLFIVSANACIESESRKQKSKDGSSVDGDVAVVERPQFGRTLELKETRNNNSEDENLLKDGSIKDTPTPVDMFISQEEGEQDSEAAEHHLVPAAPPSPAPVSGSATASGLIVAYVPPATALPGRGPSPSLSGKDKHQNMPRQPNALKMKGRQAERQQATQRAPNGLNGESKHKSDNPLASAAKEKKERTFIGKQSKVDVVKAGTGTKSKAQLESVHKPATFRGETLYLDIGGRTS